MECNYLGCNHFEANTIGRTVVGQLWSPEKQIPVASNVGDGNLIGEVMIECSGYLGVSLNGGFSPQIIHLNRIFHYKPSILGYHYFRKPPFVG